MHEQISPYGERWVGSPAKSDERFLPSLDERLQDFRRRLVDGESPVNVRRDVESLLEELTCSEKPNSGYYDEPNTLLRFDWRDTWRQLGEFDATRLHSWLLPVDLRPATDQEKCWTERTWDSLREAFEQMIQFVVEGTTDHGQRKYAGELCVMIGDYLDARGYDVNGRADPPEARTKQPVAQTDQVILYGPDDQPVVDGRSLDRLTKPQYDVILTLIKVGPAGLNKDGLATKSKHEGARNILSRLANKSPDWASVIVFPGKPGEGGYSII